MDTSSFADWTSIILFFATITTGLWKANKWLRLKLSQSEHAHAEAKLLTAQLIAASTNAEKRADIYSYLTLTSIEFNAERTRRVMAQWFLSLIIIFLLTSLGLLVNAIDWSSTQGVIMALLVISLVAGFLMLLFYHRLICKLEDGMLTGTKKGLEAKIDIHVG